MSTIEITASNLLSASSSARQLLLASDGHPCGFFSRLLLKEGLTGGVQRSPVSLKNTLHNVQNARISSPKLAGRAAPPHLRLPLYGGKVTHRPYENSRSSVRLCSGLNTPKFSAGSAGRPPRIRTCSLHPRHVVDILGKGGREL